MIFRRKTFLTQAENQRVLEAIQSMECKTSGELRVYIESKNYLVNPLERAAEIFHHLGMFKTRERNGVLIYVAVKHREAAILGDEGIHKAVGSAFWNKEISKMMEHFKNNALCEGLIQCINDVGEVLCNQFPYDLQLDQNELSDEIVFGA
jgi:uncharacterized membrane protein